MRNAQVWQIFIRFKQYAAITYRYLLHIVSDLDWAGDMQDRQGNKVEFFSGLSLVAFCSSFYY
jgi:hypothetical protein